jgi:antitoxin component of RelBE/YafQ-DinJ toxin-antitoxin module
MVDITIEIEEGLLNDVQKICSELGTTIEQLIIDFLHFCARPENYETVRKWLCDGKAGDL